MNMNILNRQHRRVIFLVNTLVRHMCYINIFPGACRGICSGEKEKERESIGFRELRGEGGNTSFAPSPLYTSVLDYKTKDLQPY